MINEAEQPRTAAEMAVITHRDNEAKAAAIAKAFCEASGRYRWEDTRGLLREWYLQGARAVLALAPWERMQ